MFFIYKDSVCYVKMQNYEDKMQNDWIVVSNHESSEDSDNDDVQKANEILSTPVTGIIKSALKKYIIKMVFWAIVRWTIKRYLPWFVIKIFFDSGLLFPKPLTNLGRQYALRFI